MMGGEHRGIDTGRDQWTSHTYPVPDLASNKIFPHQFRSIDTGRYRAQVDELCDFVKNL